MKLTYIKKYTKYNTIRQVLKRDFNISNKLLTKLKKENKIFLNGKNIYLDYTLNYDDKIEVFIDFKEDSSNIKPVKMNLNIVYEDEYFIVLDKPCNMPIHPSILHYEDTLSNGLKYYFNENKIYKKIRPVNRLDRNTSGLVIFAKNEYIQELFIKQMNHNLLHKEYIALLEGNIKNDEGIIDAPITRKKDSIIERCVSPDGDIAITTYKVIKRYNKYSLVKFNLITR